MVFGDNTFGNPLYILGRNQGTDPIMMQARKRLASRYFQLKTGHALIRTHWKRIGKSGTDHCWWCDKAQPQTVGHLLRDCRKWRKEQRILWKKVGRGCQHTCIPLLFANRKATKAILDFLEQTEVGNRVPERTREEHEEGRDAAWGWGEEAWEEPLGFTRE